MVKSRQGAMIERCVAGSDSLGTKAVSQAATSGSFFELWSSAGRWVYNQKASEQDSFLSARTPGLLGHCHDVSRSARLGKADEVAKTLS